MHLVNKSFAIHERIARGKTLLRSLGKNGRILILEFVGKGDHGIGRNDGDKVRHSSKVS